MYEIHDEASGESERKGEREEGDMGVAKLLLVKEGRRWEAAAKASESLGSGYENLGYSR